ncbi:APC family permease [Rhodococcus sp. JVH1]|uniref:APC family permease n=1 Tax=Rhodococcus sp. JVH1 TaxID=745408 RepID=UPI0002721D25|nr:APC family permease [Rhodococcus sp. JVH1]EJI95811.1 amino acid permease family protein [Rhodococcus sp. JVH1]
MSRWQLVALTLSSFVPAVGIASFPVLLIGPAGYGSWMAALISAVAGFCIGRTVIVFARRYVSAGSLASYMVEVFDPWARAATAASLFLGYLGQLMCSIVLFAMYTISFATSLGMASAGDPPMMIGLFVLAAAVPAAVACRGLDTSVRIAVRLAVISVPLLLFVSGASAVHTGLELGRQLTMEGSSVSGIVVGLAAGAAWLVSFESAASLATETSDPKRNVPTAVMAWPVVLGTTYLLVTFLQVPGLMASTDALEAGKSAPAALAESAGLAENVGRLTDIVLAVAVFASLIGFVNYASRVTMSLSQDGLLPSGLRAINARVGTPVNAILLNVGLSAGILIATVLISPNAIFTVYAAVATLTVYFWVLPYILVGIGAVVFLMRLNKLTVGVVISAVIGIVTMAWLFVNSIINPPESPIDVMTYVAVIAVAVLGSAFHLADSRARRATARTHRHRYIHDATNP